MNKFKFLLILMLPATSLLFELSFTTKAFAQTGLNLEDSQKLLSADPSNEESKEEKTDVLGTISEDLEESKIVEVPKASDNKATEKVIDETVKKPVVEPVKEPVLEMPQKEVVETNKDADALETVKDSESVKTTEISTKDSKTKEDKNLPPETKEELNTRLQLDRRVDVVYEGRVKFKNGAAIWAVEDPSLDTPKLEIQAPEQIDITTKELRFRVFTNYFPFINTWELGLYKRDKVGVKTLIKTLKGERDELYNISYPINEGDYEIGDTIFYQLKVFQNEDIFDIVREKRIEFIKRVENQNLDENDDTLDSNSLEAIWGQNSIEKQNIPIRGSRVRIVGRNFPINQSLEYRGQRLQVDQAGNFLVEEHFPIGEHKIQVNVTDRDTKDKFMVPFDLSVSGNYFFAVAIADMRIGSSKLSEQIAGVDSDDTYDSEMFTDGRLAFYLKGKVKGKYLITAQMDTTEGPIKNMFDSVFRKDSEALFRRLDPDRYYPVYGDNSTTTETAASQGQLYVKVEVDQSYILWGNDNLETTRTLLSQYNRTLYGAHAKYKSRKQTKFGENRTSLSVFAANPESLLGHNEFRATGSRVYRLRHNDIIQGSEKIVLELRDRDTGLLVSTSSQIVLEPFKDYEFDYLAGRIVLTREITNFDIDGSSSVTTGGTNNSGREQYFLVADYEYSPFGNDLDETSVGGSLEKWIGDYVAVGGTYVEEGRAGSEYSLKGLDATLKLGQQSFVKAERSETDSVQSSANFISEDGGLSFFQKELDLSTNPQDQSGKALAVESRLFLNDFIKSEKTDAVLTTWYRDYEAGFSTARRQVGADLKEYGLDYEMTLNSSNTIKSKIAVTDQTAGQKEQILVLSYGKDFRNGTTVSAEYRKEDQTNSSTGQDDSGSVIGLQLNQRLTRGWTVYGRAQDSVKEEGNYQENSRWALGTKFRISRKFEGTAEYSDGDRGESHLFGLGYNVSESHRVYSNFGRSIDTSSGEISDGVTLGQRKRFKSGVSLTQENQFTTTQSNSGVGQLYGLDYNLNQKFNLRTNYSNTRLTSQIDDSETLRENVGLGVTYTQNQDVRASSQFSYVEDEGVEDGTDTNNQKIRQYILTNSLNWRLSPSHSFLIEADYSNSVDRNTDEDLARFIEGNLGYAYRPVLNDRFNFFFKYTYLYDLDSRAQENARNDQRVNIFSLEGSYDLTRKWQLGSRVAYKVGSERLIRGQGPWIDSALAFAQLRARYHIVKKWDGLFELRLIDTVNAQESEMGLLLGIDYHLGNNFKVGAGYNFSNFNDDLINFNFNSQGWFLNVVGKL